MAELAKQEVDTIGKDRGKRETQLQNWNHFGMLNILQSMIFLPLIISLYVYLPHDLDMALSL